jgi:altronate dehydratase
LVLPSVVCAGLVAEALESDTAVALSHQHGCLQVGDDLTHTRSIFTALGTNPNVAATLIVSLGCETLQGSRLAAAIAESGRPVELVGIQAAGGTGAAIERARGLVENLHLTYGTGQRERIPQSEVLIGLDSEDGPVAAAIEAEAECRGIRVVTPASSQGPVVHPELAASGAQVIVSVVALDQAPVGFPLCPVVAVAGDSEIHAALAGDFDVLPEGRDPQEIAAAVIDETLRVFDGVRCNAERRGSREFVLRRLAITM